MLVPLRGYAPDLDPTEPGVLTDVIRMIPSLKGMRTSYSGQATALPALASATFGAAVLRKLDNTTRFIAGTGTKLFEASSTTWTDVSRAVGGNYGASADVRWRFAQFGNASLAANKSDTLQVSTSGAFANITGAPAASIVETIGDFVMVFDTNEGTFGDSPDRWWGSAIGDHTSWTPSIASQSATGRLTSTPGPIRAGRRLGNYIVAYKERALYRGVYIGPPIIWQWEEVANTVGAPSQESVVPVALEGGFVHFFPGFDDFYVFDGSQVRAIGSPVRETFFNDVNRSYSHRMLGLHDPANTRIYWFYVSNASTTYDSCIVYNYRSNRWGRDDRAVEMVVEYVASGITYDDLGSLFSTYDDLPAIAYDSPFWTAGQALPAFFDTAHLVRTLSGNGTTSRIVTGDFGLDEQISLKSRVRPRFLTEPTSATLTNFYRNTLGASRTQDMTTAYQSGKFDVMRSARWHSAQLDITGTAEITALDVTIKRDSDE